MRAASVETRRRDSASSAPLRRALDATSAAFGALGGASIVVIFLLVLWQMLGRATGLLAAGADDFAAYALAASASLALAYALKQGAHIRVTLISSKIRSPAVRRWSAPIARAAPPRSSKRAASGGSFRLATRRLWPLPSWPRWRRPATGSCAGGAGSTSHPRRWRADIFQSCSGRRLTT